MRQPPYTTSHALEALESVLVAGVFDQKVSVLFRDDGVWQLVHGQDGSMLAARTVARVASGLPEYDVSHLYVCSDSLARRGLTAADLVLPVREVAAAEQAELIAQHDVVMND